MTENTTTKTALEGLIEDAQKVLDRLSDEARVEGYARDEHFVTYRKVIGLIEMHMARHQRNVNEFAERLIAGFNIASNVESLVVSEAEANVAAMLLQYATSSADMTYDQRVDRIEKHVMRQIASYRLSRSSSAVHNFNSHATAEAWAEYARTVFKGIW